MLFFPASPRRLAAAATLAVIGLLSTAAHAQDPEALPELQIATGHGRNTSAPLVLREQNLLFTIDYSAEVKAWDLATGKVLKNWALPSNIWQPVAIPDRDWVIFATREGLFVQRLSDFSTVAHWKEKSVGSPFYDLATKRFFCTQPSTQGLLLMEVDLDTGAFTQRAVFPNPPYDSAISGVPQLTAFRILPLDDGRLLVSFINQYGASVVDPKNGTAIAPVSGKPRGYALGRPGEIIALTGVERIEILDARTLAVLRAADIPVASRPSQGPLRFAGFTEAKPGRPAQFVVWSYRCVLLIDPQTLRVTRKIDLTKDMGPHTLDISGLTPLAGDEWILTTWGGAHVVNFQESRVVRTLGITTYHGSRIVAAPSGFRVFLSTPGSISSRRVDFTNDGVNLTEFDEQPQHMAFSADGKWVAFNRKADSGVHLSSISDFPRKARVFNRTNKVPLGASSNFVFSPDGKHLAALSPITAHVYETATGRLVFEADRGEASASTYSSQGYGAFSADGKTFAYNITLKDPKRYIKSLIRAVDLETGAQRWELDAGYNVVLDYLPGDREILAVDTETRAVIRVDAATGHLANRTPLTGLDPKSKSVTRWKFSSDRTRLLAFSGQKFVVYEYPGLRILSTHEVPGHVLESADFFASGDFFATLTADHQIRLWKAGQPEPLARLIIFRNGRDWCLHTPDFQFQASPGGMKEVYFVKGRSIIPLESLFEQFFTPGLAPRLFADETLQPAIDVAKIKIPPRVTLALDTGTRGLAVEDDIAIVKNPESQVKIVVEATTSEEPIAEIRLYHNEKLVQATTRGLFVEDDAQARSEKRTFPLVLLPGENVFRAVAINAQRVESIPAELVVKFAPPVKTGPASTASSDDSGGGLQLHLVIVGLNKYRNPRFNLNYAVADATAVREHIEKRAAGIFTKINTHVIFDDKAVKPAIVAALQQVAATAGPRDAFIFYYAGHGVMSGEAKPKFYLVPYDVTQMYGADERLASAAISSVELQELSRLIPAQKQLFVLDACQSAGALEAVAVRGAAEQKAIAQLARSSGTHWLTASGSEQFATEFAELGHGAFTYVLLEGLAGKADSGDGRVTVNELKAWLESELPEVTQKHKGTPQFPASYGFGQDFPLTIRN